MLQIRFLSPLEKVFLDEAPKGDQSRFSGFQNEHIFLQIAVCGDAENHRKAVRIAVDSPLDGRITTRTVEHVPVMLPTLPGADDNYLRKTPGLYPDLLRAGNAELNLLDGVWQSVMVEIDPDGCAAGEYPVTVAVQTRSGRELGSVTAQVRVLAGELPAQTLIRTQWFHSDCLADYYRVPVFSAEYWRIVENFMRAAVKRGCNMILTPLFTPPLDTAVGHERTTVQLVGVERNHGDYTFDFENLHRFVRTAQNAGMRYFEMSHLFTQWGAKCAPKVMARENGEYKRIFGWETSAVDAEYARFLQALLPELMQELHALGIFEQSYFHISDEPRPEMLEDYCAARALVEPYIEGRPIMDAMSSYDLYAQGAVTMPIPCIDHLDPFLAANVPDLWTYYCISQYKDVTNGYIAMPGTRTRMLGVQLFKYDIKGFLQWGFNFYNSQLSWRKINPYLTTDAFGAFPAGDPFIVYPGENGEAEESLRSLYMHMAMQDLRALQWMAQKRGREAVLKLLEEVTLTNYPREFAFFETLREKVNAAIMA